MVDIFEEVEEELRSDRWKRLARTWLPWVGGALALALAIALAVWGWDARKTHTAGEASVAYERAMQAMGEGDTAAAATAFTEAAEAGSPAYRSLALMQQAGLAVTDNRIEEAVTLFDEAADASRDPLIADAAALKAAFLVMDTAPLADVEARLEPLTRDDRPFQAFAREALGLARLQHGQKAEARELFALLTFGQNVPDGVRQRAQAAIDMIDSGTADALPAIVAAQAAQPSPQQPSGPQSGAGGAPAQPPQPAQ